MSGSCERAVFDALCAVIIDGAYGAQALNRALKNCTTDEKPYCSHLFYGVLDKSIQFDYIIGKLADKRPRASVAVLIKIGLYLLRYSDTPDYAAVHKTVELAKSAGKAGAAGFINVILKKSREIVLPQPDGVFGLSVVASYPEWIVKKLISDYGFDFTKEHLLYCPPTHTHIRVNRNRIDSRKFEELYPETTTNRSKYGYYVTHNQLNSLKTYDYFIQSLSSMLAVNRYLDRVSPKTVLDLCAAPGGKSVYLKELMPSASITACDVYPHRAELIRKYVKKAGVQIAVELNDATVFNPSFFKKFDLVVCDVPCSGLGVVSKKPEILWNRSEGDIPDLANVQLKILTESAKYVTENGRLSYSTCTILKEENEQVCERFLNENPGFALDGDYLSLFPHKDHCDGFFVANFRRV